LSTGEHPLQIHRNHGIKVGLAHLADDFAIPDLDQLRIARDPGIVDQDVDPPAPLKHLAYSRLNVVL